MTMTNLNNKLVIAVDPSICNIGVSVFFNNRLEKMYSIKPKINEENEYSRHLDIVKAFVQLLDDLCVKVVSSDVYLVIESQYVNPKMVATVLKTATATGVIVGVCMNYVEMVQKQLKVISVSPSKAKSAVGVKSGLKRKESKEEVKKKVWMLYPQCKEIKSQDAIDSVAIGLAGLNIINNK